MAASTRTKCVTSCAGSTSYLSVVAQTRRGFLSGGSAFQTKRMTEVEKEIQLEEAYARVTVALTRAQRLCVYCCWIKRAPLAPLSKDLAIYICPISPCLFGGTLCD